MKHQQLKCCICGKDFSGYGNSALPLVNGICCDECNGLYVILARVVMDSWISGRADRKVIRELNPTPVVGDHVLILEMQGEPAYEGKYGIIEHIDDAGQLHGTWGGCALIPNEDTYLILERERENA